MLGDRLPPATTSLEGTPLMEEGCMPVPQQGQDLWLPRHLGQPLLAPQWGNNPAVPVQTYVYNGHYNC